MTLDERDRFVSFLFVGVFGETREKWSRNWDAAGRLIERLHKEYPDFILSPTKDGRWQVILDSNTRREASTAQLAVCYAAIASRGYVIHANEEAQQQNRDSSCHSDSELALV